MTPPKFLYFDLGKVLLNFSVERMTRQVAAVAGIDAARVMEVVYEAGLQKQYETGQVSSREFYDVFCRQTGTKPDYAALRLAGSDIFELNASMLPIVAQLHQAGYPMGILSNTCESHWEYCRERFRTLIDFFGVYALSYRVGAVKPDATIFHAAAELAGCRVDDVFFVDDTPGHVSGARAVGIDAVQYTSTPEFVAELRKRDVRFNYFYSKTSSKVACCHITYDRAAAPWRKKSAM